MTTTSTVVPRSSLLSRDRYPTVSTKQGNLSMVSLPGMVNLLARPQQQREAHETATTTPALSGLVVSSLLTPTNVSRSREIAVIANEALKITGQDTLHPPKFERREEQGKENSAMAVAFHRELTVFRTRKECWFLAFFYPPRSSTLRSYSSPTFSRTLRLLF